MAMAVRTPQVKDRRSLRFGRMSDIRADVEMLDAAPSIRTTGNWTAAQNVDHVAALIEGSLDGIPVRGPLWMRMMGKLVRSSALNKPMRPGFKLPKAMREFGPSEDVTWEQALGRLRAVVERIENGARMEEPSPFLGELSHEEWEQLHCRHAELHLSFLHPGGGDG